MVDPGIELSRGAPVETDPLDLGEETLGQRLGRLRKERGNTQQELAQRIGTIQALVSDYERGKLRLNAEMLARFAPALEINADELLSLVPTSKNGTRPSRKVLLRLEKIEQLPPAQQTTLPKTIDTFLKGTAVRGLSFLERLSANQFRDLRELPVRQRAPDLQPDDTRQSHGDDFDVSLRHTHRPIREHIVLRLLLRWLPSDTSHTHLCHP